MKQKFLNFLETKGITASEFVEMDPAKVAEIHNEYADSALKAVQEATEKSASKEELSTLKSELLDAQKEMSTSFNKLNEATFEIGKQVKKMMDEGRTSTKKETLVSQVKANFDTIKAIAKGANKELVIKALTTRASVTNNEQAFDLPDIGQLATRKLSLYDIFPKLRVSSTNHNGVIRYYDWDQDTIARAAAMVAEGAAFPESTAKWIKGSIAIQKIGDTLPVTEEFLEDEAMFAAELEMFLQINVALEEDNQLCNGDGTGNNLTGLYASIDAYTPVASGITDASIYDLLVKVKEDITVAGGSKYNPDVVIAPSSVINQMKLKKDANNNYILPPFVSRDGNQVDGMLVIQSDIAPSNTLVVCDRRFGRIYEMGGVEIAKGFVNAQFGEDEMTIKARKRLAFLIREADKGGFRKVTSVSAALTTLATP